MKLIVRADDLGISEGVNCGIARALQARTVSCVGLMPNMLSAKHGVSLIEKYDVCLGQHTNISLGKPLSDPKDIPSLVDKDGLFYTSHHINQRKNDTINVQECEIEIEAQLQRFIELTGRKPDYFDGHAVFSKNYFIALENIAKKYNLFYINPMDPCWQSRYNIHSLGFVKLDNQGLYNPQQYMSSHLVDILNHDCSIVVFHPGYLDQYILNHSSYTLIRPMECDFLCSQWFQVFISKNHIQIVDFRNYR